MGKNKFLIILGSNTDCRTNIAVAEHHLHNAFGDYVCSKTEFSTPIGMAGSPRFANKCLAIISDKTASEIKAICKAIEKLTGRKPEDKAQGVVRIDIDLVAAGDTVLKPDDYSREYARTFTKTYEKLHVSQSVNG